MTASSRIYVCVWWSKIDVWVGGIIYSTTLAIWIVGSGQFLEVSCAPSIDSNDENGYDEGEEEDETDNISAGALLSWIAKLLLGTTLLWVAEWDGFYRSAMI